MLPSSFWFLPRLALALALGSPLPACDTDRPDNPNDAFTEAESRVGDWTFVNVGGAVCRDGSPTGFGVRLQEGADDLMIYLEGGGACFNNPTCSSNPARFGEADFEALRAHRGSTGIFSTAEANPVGGWNMVYVPYCTGDIHGGRAPDATVPGVEGVQQFVGHENIGRYLALLAPYFGDPDKVLLTGASAGGFGTLVNFAQVADHFDGSDLYLLDDSGPIFFADDALSPALQHAFTRLWRFDRSLPPDAAAVLQPDGLPGIYAYYSERYPDATFGLTSFLQDETIRYFFGFGQPDGTISGDEFAAGLRDVRENLPANWGTYYAPGDGHTLTPSPTTYSGSVGGVPLNEWVGDLLHGEVSHVDPSGPVRPARTSEGS
ncbi:MAG TPA: pectin acetylesterase-family hydrolase [Rubricoccaceae bacterium]|jgi:hypothetical protein